MGAFAYDLTDPLPPRIEEEIQRLQLVDARVGGLVLIPAEGTEGEERTGRYRIVFTTRRLGEITGYEADELVGQVTDWLVGPGTDPVALTDLHACLEMAEAADFDLLSYTKAGVAFWAHVQVQPVLRGDGKVEGFAVYLALAEKSRASYLSDMWQRIEDAWSGPTKGDL